MVDPVVGVLLGSGLTGTLGVVAQRVSAARAGAHERRTDLRSALDRAIEALGNAEFRFARSHMAAAAAIARSASVDEYLEREEVVNLAIRDMGIARGHLSVRAPQDTELLRTFTVAYDALLAWRDAIGPAVNARAMTSDIGPKQKTAGDAISQFTERPLRSSPPRRRGGDGRDGHRMISRAVEDQALEASCDADARDRVSGTASSSLR